MCLELVDFVLSGLFELVEAFADFTFAFGGYVAEVVHEGVDLAFLTKIFNAQCFEFFGVVGLEVFDLLEQGFDSFDHN